LRQTIPPSGFPDLFVQQAQEQLDLVPRDVFHREALQVRIGNIFYLFLPSAFPSKVAGVRAHDFAPFLLRNLIWPEVEIVGNLYFLIALLAAASAEPGRTFPHAYKLHAQTVRELG